MKCWPKKNLKLTNTVKLGLYTQRTVTGDGKKRVIFFQQCLFCFKSIENMPGHINRVNKL